VKPDDEAVIKVSALCTGPPPAPPGPGAV